MQTKPIDVLPLGIEHLPHNLAALIRFFPWVFSTIDDRHGPSPRIAQSVAPRWSAGTGNSVVDGPEGQACPGRYAKMFNVWFLPSPPTLLSWLKKLGFVEPRLVDLNITSTDEQRSTQWMTFDSLSDFLDPQNPELTAEGHPRPQRAIILAEAPF